MRSYPYSYRAAGSSLVHGKKPSGGGRMARGRTHSFAGFRSPPWTFFRWVSTQMIATHASQICDALQSRRHLRFYYKDHLTPTVVEPYTYGENAAGNRMLSAWLISGETHDPTPPLWRLYREEEMRRVEVLGTTFAQNRPGYNPSDSRFRSIRCRVAAKSL